MSERTIARHMPLSRYRIIQRHGNGKATIEYADERVDAIDHARQVGGEIECYVYGIGWEPMSKVAAAESLERAVGRLEG